MRNRRAPGRRAMAPSASVTSPARPTSSVRTVTTDEDAALEAPGDEEPQQVERRGIVGTTADRRETTTGGVAAPARSSTAAMASNRSNWLHAPRPGSSGASPASSVVEHVGTSSTCGITAAQRRQPRPQRVASSRSRSRGPHGERAPILAIAASRRRGVSCRCPGRPRARRTGRRPGRRAWRGEQRAELRSRPTKGLPPSSSHPHPGHRRRVERRVVGEDGQLEVAQLRLGSSPSSSRSIAPARRGPGARRPGARSGTGRGRAWRAVPRAAGARRPAPAARRRPARGVRARGRRRCAPRAPPGGAPRARACAAIAPVVDELDQRWAPPQGQSASTSAVGPAGRPVGQLDLPGRGELVEAWHVDRRGRQVEPVAGLVEHQSGSPCVEHAAQPRHVGLQRAGGRGGWSVTPDRLDQRLGADRAAAGGDERGEDEPGLAAAHVDRLPSSSVTSSGPSTANRIGRSYRPQPGSIGRLADVRRVKRPVKPDRANSGSETPPNDTERTHHDRLRRRPGRSGRTGVPAVEPYRIADDTYLIPNLVPAEPGTFVFINTMVILAEEPIVVDTGAPLYREHWLDAVDSVVDLDDVRWVFLSHDDGDHIGNMPESSSSLRRPPSSRNFFSNERAAPTGPASCPLDRQVWLEAGDSFDAGDRRLHLFRPPIFDGPTTRGLSTSGPGVMWAVDSFAALTTGAVYDAATCPPTSTTDRSRCSTASSRRGTSGSTPSSTDVTSTRSRRSRRPPSPRRTGRCCVARSSPAPSTGCGPSPASPTSRRPARRRSTPSSSRSSRRPAADPDRSPKPVE